MPPTERRHDAQADTALQPKPALRSALGQGERQLQVRGKGRNSSKWGERGQRGKPAGGHAGGSGRQVMRRPLNASRAPLWTAEGGGWRLRGGYGAQ